MLQTLKNKLYSTWDAIKAWFKRSESIFVARITAFIGFVVAAIEGMDWPSLISMDFTNAIHNTQALVAGGLIFLHGIVSEIARRMRDPSLGQ